MSDTTTEQKQTEKVEEEVTKKEPFAMTIPDGESLMIDFEKHEHDVCMVLHGVRMFDKNEAKLIVRYKFYAQDNLTEEELKTAELVDHEDEVVFHAGEKEKSLEYEFVNSCDPVFEAQGSEIRIDGVFVQDAEEEDEYEYEYDEEEEEEEAKEEVKEETKEVPKIE